MENKAKEILQKGINELGLAVSERQLRQFDMFLNNIKFFNKKVNLTTITEDKEVVIKHFLDSLSAMKSGIIKEKQWIVDIGAGAGFPGVPIKIMMPSTMVYLVESNNKKTLFLDIVVNKLGLENIAIINDRAENFGKAFGRDKFDVAIARALSKLPVLFEYAVPMIKKNARLIAMKAKISEEELTGSKKACEVLNCEIEKIVDVKVPYLDAERKLIITKKTWGTPKIYPRRPGLPNKKPLG